MSLFPFSEEYKQQLVEEDKGTDYDFGGAPGSQMILDRFRVELDLREKVIMRLAQEIYAIDISEFATNNWPAVPPEEIILQVVKEIQGE